MALNGLSGVFIQLLGAEFNVQFWLFGRYIVKFVSFLKYIRKLPNISERFQISGIFSNREDNLQSETHPYFVHDIYDFTLFKLVDQRWLLLKSSTITHKPSPFLHWCNEWFDNVLKVRIVAHIKNQTNNRKQTEMITQRSIFYLPYSSFIVTSFLPPLRHQTDKDIFVV